MMLISVDREEQIMSGIIPAIIEKNTDDYIEKAGKITELIHQSIPDKRKISVGIYSVIKQTGESVYYLLKEKTDNAFPLLTEMFDSIENDTLNYKSKAPLLNAIIHYALDKENQEMPEAVFPYTEAAAGSDFWEMREYAQGFFRQLTARFPEDTRPFLLRLTESPDPNLRRFVSETLRPVVELRKLKDNPEFALSILERLFHEKNAYPRTSVGNNLSDHSRYNPELIFGIVKKLAESNDYNSIWIATRACRNLVKKEPVRVMDIFGIDEYKYKNNIYKRSDYK